MLKRLVGAAALSVTLAAPGAAQQLGIATMGQGTSGYSMGTAIARVLSDNGIGALVQPNAGTSAYMPLIQMGELDFGIANAIEVTDAHNGTGAFEGRALDAVRPAARLFPFRVGVFVRDDSEIEQIADLAGQRLTYGFTSQVTLVPVLNALLASGGVSPDQIEPVLVPNVVRGADDFAAGRADAAFFAMGSGKVTQTDAAVGGVRFLPIPEGAEAEAAMQAIVPQSYVTVAEPGPGLTGVDAPLRTMAYDYMLVVGDHVPAETVEQVVTILQSSKDELVASFASFSLMDPDSMRVDVGVPYHPGADAALTALGQ